ncbi:DEAD/DEAH box helicase domain protein [Leptothrix cholodnii SP-6]|uniref:DEAD-box ATP-dependent RNA helicase RhpA n=1 Tax=Leptothrix cholodnii (strain ATCC 51168 / LMG 8142 / SP-6) TaxID=395495 RepID=B1XZ89_LEPCP|nr:ATP-dependent RNA helicase DbpA [Leptothrix cholodnii]ACB35259.1 DEAD/DEAH box helicase domain protein [Leptothrix cholodnii SP-6]
MSSSITSAAAAADPASNAALSFSSLPLPPATLANLQQLGYTAMTPIQAASLPLALAGHDLIAQAKTGSGKTAAFALALLANLNPRRFAVQSLVLCPTRELAEQVTQEVRRLARAEDHIKVLTLVGGTTMRPQLASLEHGAHIVIGTPGRIMDHLERGSLDLSALNTLVLDEADRMLDMGFFDDIKTVIQQCPKERQTLLFSATYPEGIARISAAFMRAPKEIKLTEKHAAGKIRQIFYEVREDERLHAVSLLLDHYRPVSTLAFCNTKQQCRDLVQVLRAQGYSALELHGDLEQRDRDQVLIQFANQSCSVLVATDIAARGLDISQLGAVINVEITPDIATHTHRIGRTGRADEEGWAFSLASMDEMGRVGQIEVMHGFTAQWQPLATLTKTSAEPLLPPMQTIQILGGRKEKIRPGDVMGALTKDMGFAGAQIGKINVNEFSTYVAVAREIAPQVERKLAAGRVKGRSVKVRLMAG